LQALLLTTWLNHYSSFGSLCGNNAVERALEAALETIAAAIVEVMRALVVVSALTVCWLLPL
jgi:hypothetical protein